MLAEYPRSQWWAFAVVDDKVMTELEAIQEAGYGNGSKPGPRPFTNTAKQG